MNSPGDHRCPPGYTKCASGQCINATYWCDWFENCFDKSDEANCARDQMDDQRRRPNAACDPATQFTCDNGQCIAREYRCVLGANPREQCADGSNLRSCSQWNCTSESRDLIKCAGSYCVVPELKCNGKLDCPRLSDWADEASCCKYIVLCLCEWVWPLPLFEEMSNMARGQLRRLATLFAYSHPALFLLCFFFISVSFGCGCVHEIYK